jgi:hypothetical protein
LSVQRKYLHERATRIPEGSVHHTQLLGAALAAVPEAMELPDVIYDQRGAGSCFAFGYGKAVEAYLRANPPSDGAQILEVSALAVYALARSIMAGNPDALLTDGGTDPAVGVEALARFGVTCEQDYPYSDQEPDLNNRLEPAELEEMAVAKVTGFAWITESGQALVDVIKRSIAARCPVAFGMSVDRAFEELGTGIYDGPTGPTLGGHAIRLSGYGPNFFKVTNSWGTGIGDGGYFKLSTAFVAGGGIWDACAITAAPIVRRA